MALLLKRYLGGATWVKLNERQELLTDIISFSEQYALRNDIDLILEDNYIELALSNKITVSSLRNDIGISIILFIIRHDNKDTKVYLLPNLKQEDLKQLNACLSDFRNNILPKIIANLAVE